jgi:hypothetical protein
MPRLETHADAMVGGAGYSRRGAMVSGLAAAWTVLHARRDYMTLVGAPSPILRLEDPRVFDIEGYGQLPAVAVGSRVTCVPAPTDTDQDWLACVPRQNWHADMLLDALETSGQWTRCEGQTATVSGTMSRPQSQEYPDDFSAWRMGEDNLIVALERHFYDTFLVASRICQRMNVLRKADRIVIFDAVQYGKWRGAEM